MKGLRRLSIVRNPLVIQFKIDLKYEGIETDKWRLAFADGGFKIDLKYEGIETWTA